MKLRIKNLMRIRKCSARKTRMKKLKELECRAKLKRKNSSRPPSRKKRMEKETTLMRRKRKKSMQNN